MIPNKLNHAERRENSYPRGYGVRLLSGISSLRTDPEKYRDSLPSLTLKETLRVTAPENVGVSNTVNVYSVDFQSTEYSISSVNSLAFLPVGEYTVCLYKYTDSRNGDESILDYVTEGYECFFRLIIEEKHEKYGFSSVSVISNRFNKDRPMRIQSPLSAEDYFTDENFSYLDLPSVTCEKNNMSAVIPDGISVGNFRVYDLKYDLLSHSPKSFEELSNLPAGSFIIVYSETEKGIDSDSIFLYSMNYSIFDLVMFSYSIQKKQL